MSFNKRSQPNLTQSLAEDFGDNKLLHNNFAEFDNLKGARFKTKYRGKPIQLQTSKEDKV